MRRRQQIQRRRRSERSESTAKLQGAKEAVAAPRHYRKDIKDCKHPHYRKQREIETLKSMAACAKSFLESMKSTHKHSELEAKFDFVPHHCEWSEELEDQSLPRAERVDEKEQEEINEYVAARSEEAAVSEEAGRLHSFKRFTSLGLTPGVVNSVAGDLLIFTFLRKAEEQSLPEVRSLADASPTVLRLVCGREVQRPQSKL